MDDCDSCCYGFWCEPCLFGSNANKIDGSNCICMCLAYTCLADFGMCWLLHYMKRKSLRDKFNLREDPSCGDCLTTFCCGPCALCQEARFLKAQSMF
jgi:Cys-rich protein (TIGR01571 family)